MVSPFAPHIGEELWRRLGHDGDAHLRPVPGRRPGAARRRHRRVPGAGQRQGARPHHRRRRRRRRRPSRPPPWPTPKVAAALGGATRRRSSSSPAGWSTSSSDASRVFPAGRVPAAGLVPQQTLGSPVAGQRDSGDGAECRRSPGRRLPHREGDDGPGQLPADAERPAPGVQPVVQPRPDRRLRRPHGRDRAAVAEVDGPRALRAPVARRSHDPLPPRRRRAVAAVAGRARRAGRARAARRRRPSARCAPAPSGTSATSRPAPSRRSSTRSPPAAPSPSPCASSAAPASARAAGRTPCPARRTSTRRRTPRTASTSTRRRRGPAAGAGGRERRPGPRRRRAVAARRAARAAARAGARTSARSVVRRRRPRLDELRAPGCSCSSACPSAAGRRGTRGRGASRSAGSGPRCAPCRGCGPRSARRRRPPWARRSSATRCPTRTSSTSRTARRRTPRRCTCRRRGCRRARRSTVARCPPRAARGSAPGDSSSRHSASVRSISGMPATVPPLLSFEIGRIGPMSKDRTGVRATKSSSRRASSTGVSPCTLWPASSTCTTRAAGWRRSSSASSPSSTTDCGRMPAHEHQRHRQPGDGIPQRRSRSAPRRSPLAAPRADGQRA